MDISINDCLWHYDISGAADGRTVLFLHGWGCTGDIFAPILKGMERFRLVTLDFPGHGRSAGADFASLYLPHGSRRHACCLGLAGPTGQQAGESESPHGSPIRPTCSRRLW